MSAPIASNVISQNITKKTSKEKKKLDESRRSLDTWAKHTKVEEITGTLKKLLSDIVKQNQTMMNTLKKYKRVLG